MPSSEEFSAIEQVIISKKDKKRCIYKVKVVGKKNVFEDTVFVIGKNRLWFFTPNAKIKSNYHFLDLMEVKSPAPRDLSLRFSDAYVVSIVLCEEVDMIVQQLRTAFFTAFPSTSSQPEFNIIDASGNAIPELPEITVEIGPCGGFSRTYACIANYYGTALRQEICWDIDNLFEELSIKEFNFREWGVGVSLNDLKTICKSLENNDWFESFILSGYKLGNAVIPFIADMLAENAAIHTVSLAGLGATKDGFVQFFHQISGNLNIRSLDLSSNALDDKVINTFCSETLVNPSLAASMGQIFQALTKNVAIYSSLEVLNVSNNSLQSDGLTGLVSFITVAQRLRAQWSEMKFVKTPKLQNNTIAILDISGNKIPPKLMQQHLPWLVQFLSMLSPSLLELRATGMGLPTNVEFLKPLITAIHNVRTLDLSDNEFEEGLGLFVDLLTDTNESGLPNLNSLALNRTVLYKSKHVGPSVNALIKLISSPRPPIQELKFAGGGAGAKYSLRHEISPFVFALLTNETISSLDITGHQAGGSIAVALSKVLQVNNTLRTLAWDENAINRAGFEAFLIGLQRNQTLTRVTPSFADVAILLRQHEGSPMAQLILTSQDDIHGCITTNIGRLVRAAEADEAESAASGADEYTSGVESAGADTYSAAATTAPLTQQQQSQLQQQAIELQQLRQLAQQQAHQLAEQEILSQQQEQQLAEQEHLAHLAHQQLQEQITQHQQTIQQQLQTQQQLEQKLAQAQQAQEAAQKISPRLQPTPPTQTQQVSPRLQSVPQPQAQQISPRQHLTPQPQVQQPTPPQVQQPQVPHKPLPQPNAQQPVVPPPRAGRLTQQWPPVQTPQSLHQPKLNTSSARPYSQFMSPTAQVSTTSRPAPPSPSSRPQSQFIPKQSAHPPQSRPVPPPKPRLSTTITVDPPRPPPRPHQDETAEDIASAMAPQLAQLYMQENKSRLSVNQRLSTNLQNNTRTSIHFQAKQSKRGSMDPRRASAFYSDVVSNYKDSEQTQGTASLDVE